MKIKIGEYVRTEDGYIGKLVEYIPNALNYLKIFVNREIRHSDNTIDKYIYTRYGFSLKHSYNIKDLIEVDDYVNGHKVVSLHTLTGNIEIEGQGMLGSFFIKHEDIETIVTKEQFEERKYRINE